MDNDSNMIIAFMHYINRMEKMRRNIDLNIGFVF